MRFALLLCFVLLSGLAGAQDRIVRFVGYDGSLFAWSGRLSARAAPDKSGWLEPIIAGEDARRWKDLLIAEGYDGKWSNFLTASKDLKAGTGDVPLEASILFKQVAEGNRILVVVPGKRAVSASISATGTQGLPDAMNAVGGPVQLNSIASAVGIDGASGRMLWQLLNVAVEATPRAVLLPSKVVVWLESLTPEAFASVSAITGRPVTVPAIEPKRVEPVQTEAGGSAWMFAAIGLGVLCLGLGGLLVYRKPKVDTPGTAIAGGASAESPREREFQAAARKVQQTLVKVPRTDALSWLRDEAPQQLSDLVAGAKVGQAVVQKLGVKDQQELDQTLSDLLDAENVHRQLWNELGEGSPREILASVQQQIADLQARATSHEKLMLGAATAAGINSSGITPQEALQHALAKLKKQAEDSQSKAASLEPAARTLEALKPTAALLEQIRQALHGVRPALADREVFAICGYLLNYSVANLQVAAIRGDNALKQGMLHNIRTISSALAEYEDSFMAIHKSIPAAEIAFSPERHEDHADYLTLLQKALDLRNLRLSPFVIATDAQGRAYSVTTALA